LKSKYSGSLIPLRQRDPRVIAVSIRPNAYPGAALCFAMFLMLIYVLFLAAHLNTRKNDFSAVYLWSAAARKGMNPYADDLTRLRSQFSLDDNGNHHAVYPPLLIVAFEPITLLPPITAYWVWFCVSLFALMASFGLLLGREAFLFALLALFYEPLTDHFLWAQSYTVVLLLLAISIRAMANGRHTVAGVSLAIAGALKVFPLVILLYFVRTRRWRVVFAAAVGLFTISALTTGLMGWNRTLSFLASSSPEVWVHWGFTHSNVSIGATIAQLVLPLMATNSPGDHLLLWQLIFAASALALGAAVFWMTPVSDPDLRAFGLWIIAATWMFPICLPAHMVLFLAFLAVLFCRGSRASRRQAKWAAVSSYTLGVMLLPIHWTLLIAGSIAWLAAAERTCLVMLVLSSFYSAWLFSRPEVSGSEHFSRISGSLRARENQTAFDKMGVNR
jgi:hypothetical protein